MRVGGWKNMARSVHAKHSAGAAEMRGRPTDELRHDRLQATFKFKPHTASATIYSIIPNSISDISIQHNSLLACSFVFRLSNSYQRHFTTHVPSSSRHADTKASLHKPEATP